MIRLIIVDDHEMVREGLKAILVAEHDCSIVGEAANADEALTLIERLRPDIVLLDVRLPVAQWHGVKQLLILKLPRQFWPNCAAILQLKMNL